MALAMGTVGVMYTPDNTQGQRRDKEPPALGSTNGHILPLTSTKNISEAMPSIISKQLKCSVL